MRSVLLLWLSVFFALSGLCLSEPQKKTERRKEKGQELVEGSGVKPKQGTLSADIVWDGSGAGLGPDDEDGDVEEGSGKEHDAVEGSGYQHHHHAKPPVTTTASFSPATPPTSTIKDVVIEDKVEEEVTRPMVMPTRPSLPSGTSTTTTTTTTIPTRPPPPNIYDFDDHRTPLDSLPRPGLLAAIIGGIVVGVLTVVTLVMFVVYRMRKKDEGSYALDEPKQPPHYSYAYQKAPTKEFYA